MSQISSTFPSDPPPDPEKARPKGDSTADGSDAANHPRNQYQNPLASCFSRRKWHDDRYEHFKSPGIADFRQGYPRLAARANSDQSLLLYRQFGWLRCRVLLHLQDELQVLEASLQELDETHFVEDPDRLSSRRIDEAEDNKNQEGTITRKAIVDEIRSKLKEYDDLLARQRFISSIPKPSRREFRSWFDWIRNENPLITEEVEFIYRKDDIISLGLQPDGWLGFLFDGIFHILPSSLIKWLLTSSDTRRKTTESRTTYYSDERSEILIKFLFNFATLVLLILPTALLYVLDISRASRLAILIVFVVFFNVSITTLTNAKRHEVFVASAGYCAVLVVFLGSTS